MRSAIEEYSSSEVEYMRESWSRDLSQLGQDVVQLFEQEVMRQGPEAVTALLRAADVDKYASLRRLPHLAQLPYARPTHPTPTFYDLLATFPSSVFLSVSTRLK